MKFATPLSILLEAVTRHSAARHATQRLLLLGLAAVGAFLVAEGAKAQALVPTATTLPFVTYYGGSQGECAFSPCVTTVDQAGNVYIAGATRSDDFPLVNPYSSGSPGGEDLFVVKLAADTHAVEYSTYLGRGVAFDIAVDASGNAHVTGWTSDSDFPVTGNAFQTEIAGGIDAVVVKLSADGSELLYSSFLGGTGRDEGRGIDIDDTGAIYLTGQTNSDDFVTENAFQETFAGRQDAFAAKIDDDGSLEYSTYLGGENGDSGWRIVARADGSAYLTGRSGSNDFPVTPGVVQSERFSNAGFDMILVKMTAGGDIDFSTFFNETSTEEGIDLAVDSVGNAYVLTRRQGILKFNDDGTAILYQAAVDLETDVDSEGGIAVDRDGIAYAVGWVGEGIDRDLGLVVVNERGIPVYSEMIGGSDGDFGHDIAIFVDDEGGKEAYLVGKTESTDVPTADPLQESLAGVTDIVIVNVTNLESVIPNLVYLPILHGNNQ